MTQPMQGRCSESVADPDGWGFHPCSKPVRVERGGKPYCTSHDPEKVKARRDAAPARWDAEWAATKEKRRRLKAEVAACADLSTEALESGVVKDMLEALEAVIKHHKWRESIQGSGGTFGIKVIPQVKAALAKAKGGQ